MLCPAVLLAVLNNSCVSCVRSTGTPRWCLDGSLSWWLLPALWSIYSPIPALSQRSRSILRVSLDLIARMSSLRCSSQSLTVQFPSSGGIYASAPTRLLYYVAFFTFVTYFWMRIISWAALESVRNLNGDRRSYDAVTCFDDEGAAAGRVDNSDKCSTLRLLRLTTTLRCHPYLSLQSRCHTYIVQWALRHDAMRALWQGSYR